MAKFKFPYLDGVNIPAEFVAECMAGDAWAASQLIRLADRHAENYDFTFAILETCLGLVKPHVFAEHKEDEDIKRIVGLCNDIVKAVKND
jgi:hypothetical protein